MKYRIREFDGSFIIQAQNIVTTGHLWWKKTHEEWSRCSLNGMNRIRMISSISREFNTLDDAIKQIISWEKGVKFYYHPEDTINK